MREDAGVFVATIFLGLKPLQFSKQALLFIRHSHVQLLRKVDASAFLVRQNRFLLLLFRFGGFFLACSLFFLYIFFLSDYRIHTDTDRIFCSTTIKQQHGGNAYIL